MKKISLLTKIAFHISNLVLIIIYLYPGSILGWIIYSDIDKQPQLTSINFLVFSLNHLFAFMILTLLGLFSYYKNKEKILFLYLFFISVSLEFYHNLIPERNFEYKDLFGNFLGVFIIFSVFNLY